MTRIEPSAAAMRAAKRISNQLSDGYYAPAPLAAIIDAETGLAELVEALGGLVEQLANQTHPDSPWGRKALRQARDVLARVEGQRCE